ncbi:MAG: hypothetical protein MJ219_03720 [Mycoplasmoidaceae bacterium]|nr:hypothetical protein [Mycoplasmoidaceae bacterium]
MLYANLPALAKPFSLKVLIVISSVDSPFGSVIVPKSYLVATSSVPLYAHGNKTPSFCA